MDPTNYDKKALKRSLAAKPFPREEAESYTEDFDTVFEDDSIYNVAITGSFGAGKSSLIKWAISNYPHHSFHVISVSSFAKSEIDNLAMMGID